ncbi:MAG TPA: J domain-containing protein [Candidatus Saccharimonadales bacterium]|jgi:curved DNA-binding protein CbpA|nr:J domain-containing protein [Candidatus Saccharimonadales bacterium]
MFRQPINHYAVLDVGRTATKDEIRAAYRNLAKQFHPDKNHSLPDEARDVLRHRFDEVNDAYRVLSDPVTRQELDRWLGPPIENTCTKLTPSPAEWIDIDGEPLFVTYTATHIGGLPADIIGLLAKIQVSVAQLHRLTRLPDLPKARNNLFLEVVDEAGVIVAKGFDLRSALYDLKVRQRRAQIYPAKLAEARRQYEELALAGYRGHEIRSLVRLIGEADCEIETLAKNAWDSRTSQLPYLFTRIDEKVERMRRSAS